SYAEVVLAPLITDELHPAFSNLFMQTEIVAGLQTLLCHRRPRTASERNPWLFHQLNVQDAPSEAISYETDRMKFIGRGRSVANPQALALDQALTNSSGAVLDPIIAIRRRITLAPQSTAIADLLLGVAPEREACLQLAHKYRDPHLADRVPHLAWTHSQVFLHQLNISEQESALFNQLAGRILYPDARLRAEPAIFQANRRGQSDLWPMAISGDHPILLVRVQSVEGEALVRQLLQAHAYLRHKGFVFDLVIGNEEHSGYRQELQTSLGSLLNATGASGYLDRAGGVYLRAIQKLTAEEQTLLQAVAAVILDERGGALVDQLTLEPLRTIGAAAPASSSRAVRSPSEPEPGVTYPQQDLRFFNGLGGFSSDGREYILLLDKQRKTPVPWCNILANPRFGSVISESGQAYTWFQNAHEYRLTPWHNDPVTDRSGEALYIRDAEQGWLWSPTPQPCAGDGEYRTRHGFGYSVFDHQQAGIESSLRVFVDRERPVKFLQLRLVNRSAARRHLQITGYAEWIAGDLKHKTAQHVVSWQDPNSRALLARNTYCQSGDPRTLFFDVSMADRSVCNDRQLFLGPLGQESAPQLLTADNVLERLPGMSESCTDPCAAMQVNVHLLSGEAREIVFVLGAEENETRALALLQQLRENLDGGMTAAADSALAAVQAFWRSTLGAVQVSTPEPELDLLLNGWLLYQTLTCRFEARSGYYQSGGAFGFRDQLQDCMALVHAAPSLLRQHLLTAASRQFIQGDAQHWWHPPLGQGVRTRCSDDYLWLPYVLCHYVNSTSDLSILREPVAYLEGRELNDGEESYYDAMHSGTQSETLYQHAVRAIMHGLRFGEHGLPLMGSGDWNDGMDQVGIHGRGESVWLGFFLYDVLIRFAALAERCGDDAIAGMCLQYAEPLQQSLEQHGWDGQWYRRAYFDNGSMLGAAVNSECRIDAIAQSWSVLSGAGALERSRLAMHALNRHLVKRPENIIQLLDPPFDRAEPNPGYIRGYVPGVRENGGQYTHAAVWSAMAFAELGDKERAWELTRMLNPLNHGKTLAQVAQYKVEPYVAAADIYAVAPHTGRGGWTWYTGSAGWMYRLMSESLLGIKRSGTRLLISPCLPEEWDRFRISYRYHSAEYRIEVEQVDNGSETGMTVDGIDSPQEGIQLQDDGKTHQVSIRIRREHGQPDSDKREDRQRA
ncbi:MAG: GH36-type glycosyl hydrolase domain-containing protein, partial [Plesiomonas sp.]